MNDSSRCRDGTAKDKVALVEELSFPHVHLRQLSEFCHATKSCILGSHEWCGESRAVSRSLVLRLPIVLVGPCE